MNNFEIGEYVIYDNGYDYILGRVAEVRGDVVFVVYTEGCTSAGTPKDKIHKIRNQDVISESTLGYNRFNESCPAYKEECCSYYCKDKA